MRKNTVKRYLTLLLILVMISVGTAMVFERAQGCFALYDDAALAAGLLSFNSGSLAYTEPTEALPVSRPMSGSSKNPTEAPERPTDTVHTGASHPVKEISIPADGILYEDISVQNSTPYEPDIAALLSCDLPFTLDDNHTVQVIIYHTHTCESYMTEDSGVYYDDFYPRSTDGAQGVIAVGERLAAALKARGIGVVHDTTLHDHPSYEGSYGRSWDTITALREKYPNVKVTIDVHRDSMTSSDGTKYKPTFTCNGEKAAQIMIMSGYDESGDFPFWNENLILAVKLQKKCEELYPGMTRPLYFGDFTYNMDFNNGSLLIEFGTDANTVAEASRSGACLGEALASVLRPD
jgi:stage II sporulation protein P